MPVLHVVVPVFNERGTLEPCLERVRGAPLPVGWSRRIWLVDDGSAAPARAHVEAVAARLRADGAALELEVHPENRGKGAALQTGFDRVLGSGAPDDDLVVIQDADLEYDPDDYAALMAPLLAGRADAVLGTRWGEHRQLLTLKRRIHAWGNAVLTALSNLTTGFRVRDMECCYKMMPVAMLRRIRPSLTERRFGIEPQIVAALARRRARVDEVPVAYAPRGLDEGKKIGWRDGVAAIWVIVRERLRPARPGESS